MAKQRAANIVCQHYTQRKNKNNVEALSRLPEANMSLSYFHLKCKNPWCTFLSQHGIILCVRVSVCVVRATEALK